MKFIREKTVEFRGEPAILYWICRGPTGEEEVRLTKLDGTVIADDLVHVWEGMDPEDWFDRLDPHDLPVWTAENGKTEKRLLVRIRELEERVARLEPKPEPVEEPPVQVGHMDEPNDFEIPRFLAPPPAESVPTDLQALAEPGETVEQTRARLWALYRELQNKIMMALASREEVRLHERLHIHMGWLAAADERDF